jgi:hypothetical protein
MVLSVNRIEEKICLDFNREKQRNYQTGDRMMCTNE